MTDDSIITRSGQFGILRLGTWKDITHRGPDYVYKVVEIVTSSGLYITLPDVYVTPGQAEDEIMRLSPAGPLAHFYQAGIPRHDQLTPKHIEYGWIDPGRVSYRLSQAGDGLLFRVMVSAGDIEVRTFRRLFAYQDEARNWINLLVRKAVEA